MYENFVQYDKLISPINNYECKRITVQNIHNFGFISIVDLHNNYPNFPLKCQKLKDHLSKKISLGKNNYNQNHGFTLKHNEEKYLQSPKRCKNCSNIIEYKKRRNIFCSKKCSTIFNNTGRLHTTETKIKIGDKNIFKKRKDFPQSKVFFLKCFKCENIQVKKVNIQSYCVECLFLYKKIYKKECAFKLNKKDHPELFNSKLINKYGWFVSSGKNKNRTGVSWDHLYPLHLGFENSIPPEIMRHPANAELVPHHENLRRYHHHKQMITYEELLERIQQWNNGNTNLKVFFKI